MLTGGVLAVKVQPVPHQVIAFEIPTTFNMQFYNAHSFVLAYSPSSKIISE